MLIPVLGLAAETIFALIAAATVAAVVATYFSKRKTQEKFEQLEEDLAAGIPVNKTFWLSCTLVNTGMAINKVNLIMQHVSDKNVEFVIGTVKSFIDSVDADDVDIDKLYKHILGKLK